MERGQQLSIRLRLTLIFVLAIAVILTFTGIALVDMVHHSLVDQASSEVGTYIERTQFEFARTTENSHKLRVLPKSADVVIQVTNDIGTKVWAASAAIKDAPVLAMSVVNYRANSGLGVRYRHGGTTTAYVQELSNAQAAPLRTLRGEGLVFGFVYGGAINHSVRVLLLSLLVSFPLLLFISGLLIWLGLGLALSPVENIRRRVDAIAAADLSQRVPLTGGDDQIARMARTVNEMLDRLESASRFQQEFVSNASHELRSPLTTLLATTERAQGDPASANWPEVAEVIMREGRRLEGIIGDLFWLARNDEGQLELEREDVDFDDLLYEEASRVRSMSDLSIDTSMVQPTRVSGDPAMLRRMIRNVVDNAMRYARSELHFEAHYDDVSAVVTVHDDGEGIELAESSRLFERFTRADSARSRRSGGTGLGLAIVTEIVLRHGGNARFVPAPSGTTVELRVLRDAPHSKSHAAQQPKVL